MPRVWDVPVRDSTRVRDARVAAEDAAALAGLDERRTAAAALVATELATNLLKHAEGGQVLIDVVARPVLREGREEPRVVQIAAIDHGPGIADVPAALRDGFSTTRSLGAGLGTCLRLADDFGLHSRPGRGTVAVARVGTASRGDGTPAGPAVRVWADGASGSWGDMPGPGLPGGAVPGWSGGGPGNGGVLGNEAGNEAGNGPWSRPAPGVRAGGVNIPYAGADCSGDAWAWVRAGERMTLMLADGLGHGPDAARASSAAVAALHRWAHLSPAEALRQLHDALKGTRGAAVALAQLDLRAGRLRFAGIGNVGARLHMDGTWRHLLSRPGIVGVHRPGTLREEEADWGDDRLLILHTDGLPSRWTPPSDPGPPLADPAVTAAVTIRDASSPARPVRDDTAVAVLTPTPPDRP
ncbi:MULTISPECIES: ATP-binding SpoIIE family protein phosphatase [Streptomyces]|uniref:ATP-binding SpoIIE family protein phosphatase n=1 Tax=Streptomyces TaxID=1883 RepID=UPI002034E616|nr:MULTISPECIES: ATP-binding SpoIIE family protein phosphatase [Streptomyces]UUA11023.1 SpoIIE family protein phosphatase [Streptomyces koelreuteriae]UUA18629.1 SpoIIE family protein phosphatase [Streptomyces sp. CRCS-T-1]